MVVLRVVLRLTLCLRKKLRVASRYEVSRAEETSAGGLLLGASD